MIDADALLQTGRYRREEGCTNGSCWCYWYIRAPQTNRRYGTVYDPVACGRGDTPAAARWDAEKQLMNGHHR